MEADPQLVFSYGDFAVRLARRIPKFDFNRDNTILDNAEDPMLAPHPSLAELVRFAQAAYVELGGNERHSSYETKLKLPSGWKLLTTARNSDKLNGYFGAAYWSPSLQQVVLAHRGTVLTNMGALQTNLLGVVLKNYTPLISSAATFAEKVRCAINEANKQPGKHFQLSITGHSLGGWLAQITGLSVKHLKVTGGKFIESLTTDRRDGIHAHVVVFDSPGCRNMLEKIIDDYWCRHGKTVSLETLDISSYQSAPNLINTFGLHVGSIYRVIVDVSKFNKLDRNTFTYTLAAHDINNLTNALINKLKIHEMKDWPSSKIKEVLSVNAKTEYKRFHQKVSHEDKYHLDPTECDEDSMKTRYKEKGCDKSGSLRMLSEDELNVLNFWSIFKRENVQTNKIQRFLTAHNLGECKNLFLDFYIDMHHRTITCDSKEALENVIKRTKLLVRWFSIELMTAVEEQSKDIPKIIYSTANQTYLNSLPDCLYDFIDSVELRVFLRSDHRILQVKSEDCDLEMLRLFSIVCQLREPSSPLDTYVKEECHTFLRWADMQHLKESVDIINLSENFTNDNLLVINCGSIDISRDLEEEQGKSNNRKKIIFVSTYRECDIEVSFTSNQLTKESQMKLFKTKMLDIGDTTVSIADIVGETNFNNFSSDIDNLVNTTDLKEILRNSKYRIKIKNLCPNSIINHVNISTIRREVSVESVARNATSGDLLVVSGSHLQEARRKLAAANSDVEGRAIWVSEKRKAGEEKFNQIVSGNPNKKVYWLEANTSDIFGIIKQIYDKKFYIRRRFRQVIFELNDIATWSKIKDTFIFQGVPEIMRERYQKKENILIATSDEEVNNILQKKYENSVHLLKLEEKGKRFLWKSSLGSLKSLRPYIHRNTDTIYTSAIDEEELSTQKVVIIADEPGMGKSTSLASMVRQLHSDPRNWVIWINMKHFRIPSEDIPITLRDRCEFLLRENFAGDSLPFELMQFCLHHKHSRQIYFIFDGFDEIRQRRSSKIIAKDQVLELLKYLNNDTRARLWVTTRPDDKEFLENGLSTFAVMFEKVDEWKQREYLWNFWRSHLLLESGSCEDPKLKTCVNNLYNEARKEISNDFQRYMGVPLQMRMLAEIFLKQVDDYLKSETVIENTFHFGNIFSLYTEFINKKYDLYCKVRLDDEMNSDLYNTHRAVFLQTHRILSLRTLFPEFAEKHFERLDTELGEAELCRIGLVQAGGDGCENIEFTHRTLIEYFFADQIVHFLRKKVPWYGLAPLVELLLTDVLLQASYKTIRMFVNNCLQQQSISDVAREYSALEIGKLWDGKKHLLLNCGETALHLAVRENNERIVDFLIGGLKSGPPQKSLIGFVAAHDSWGRTALGFTTFKDMDADKKIMENFLTSIEPCSDEIHLELFLATILKRNSSSNELETYLETSLEQKLKPAFAEAQDFISRVARRFVMLAQVGCMEKVETMYKRLKNDIERKYILLASNNNGNTALHFAAKDSNNQIEIIKILCDHSILAIDRSCNDEGNTPLHCAAEAGHLNIVEYFINRSVHIDCPTLSDETVLHIAAKNDNLLMLEFLIEKGADINSVDNSGRTAFYKAVEKRHFDMMVFLVEKGADINFTNLKDCNALVYAAGKGDLPIVEYLVGSGADINSALNSGRTALYTSVSNGHFPVIEFLIEKGVDIHALGIQGGTVLHEAARNGHLQLVDFFIEKGVNIDLTDNFNCTALHKAAEYGHLPVVTFLVDRGCDVSLADCSGNTALHRAVKNGCVTVVEFLTKEFDTTSADDYRTTAQDNLAKEIVPETDIALWSADI